MTILPNQACTQSLRGRSCWHRQSGLKSPNFECSKTNLRKKLLFYLNNISLFIIQLLSLDVVFIRWTKGFTEIVKS